MWFPPVFFGNGFPSSGVLQTGPARCQGDKRPGMDFEKGTPGQDSGKGLRGEILERDSSRFFQPHSPTLPTKLVAICHHHSSECGLPLVLRQMGYAGAHPPVAIIAFPTFVPISTQRRYRSGVFVGNRQEHGACLRLIIFGPLQDHTTGNSLVQAMPAERF